MPVHTAEEKSDREEEKAPRKKQSCKRGLENTCHTSANTEIWSRWMFLSILEMNAQMFQKNDNIYWNQNYYGINCWKVIFSKSSHKSKNLDATWQIVFYELVIFFIYQVSRFSEPWSDRYRKDSDHFGSRVRNIINARAAMIAMIRIIGTLQHWPTLGGKRLHKSRSNKE